MKRPEKIHLNCENCGAGFSVIPSVAYQNGRLTRRFCSANCYLAVKTRVPMFTCETCGIVKARSKLSKTSGGYNHKQRFCSNECANVAQRTGATDKKGYRLIRRNKRLVFEHRDVMERMVGRPLFPHETVHHKNGDRSFNDPRNLELWSSRHGRGQRVEDKISFAKSFLSEYGISHDTFTPSEALSGMMACV